MLAKDYAGHALHIGDRITDGEETISIEAFGDCIHGTNDLGEGDIAAALGINPNTLTLKLKGKSDFTVSEAYQLHELLGLTRNEFDAIFYAPKVDNMPTTEAET